MQMCIVVQEKTLHIKMGFFLFLNWTNGGEIVMKMNNR